MTTIGIPSSSSASPDSNRWSRELTFEAAEEGTLLFQLDCFDMLCDPVLVEGVAPREPLLPAGTDEEKVVEEDLGGWEFDRALSPEAVSEADSPLQASPP